MYSAFSIIARPSKTWRFHSYKEPNMRRILRIDGGGIPGLISALVLAEIAMKTVKCTAQWFDLIAGTSTGGMPDPGLARSDENGGIQASCQPRVTCARSERRPASPSQAVMSERLERPLAKVRKMTAIAGRDTRTCSEPHHERDIGNSEWKPIGDIRIVEHSHVHGKCFGHKAHAV